jgi:AbrB family looped-hinge helix DNA binding protein
VSAAKLTTTLSTKGQLILPKAVRDRRGWSSGDRLVVEVRPVGVLLRRESVRAPTRLEDVAGMLHEPGRRPLTPAQEEAGMAEGFRRAWRRFEQTGTDYED